MEEDAQISAELLIILAALIALALVLVGQLREMGTEAKEKVEKKSEEVFKEIEGIK